jgi:hypothetical protein
MIGLGKWRFAVETMVFKGIAYLTVSDVNGAYAIKVDVEGANVGDTAFLNIHEEGGNTLTGLASTSLLKGKEIPYSLTFESDSASGFLKVPFLGKIRLNNGVRVE